MDYPAQILPQRNFKLIVADLSGYFLLRITPTDKKDELIDKATNNANVKYLCSPREQLIDFSCSLLGVYLPEHVLIKLTKVGGEKYSHYCNPDDEVEAPIYETHFILNPGRGFLCAPISELHGTEFKYKDPKNHNAEEEKFTCLVCHTPMMWNYWHFSLHWNTPTTMIKDYNDKTSRKEIQKIAHMARTLLSEILIADPPAYKEIPKEFFQKN
jgi:hypothetical protein